MIISESFALDTLGAVEIDGRNIPVWHFAILVVFFTWVIIFYLLALRILDRFKNKIRALTEYYFGTAAITEYHLYLVLTYLLIVAIGLYAEFYLHNTIVLVSAIFLPFIYKALFTCIFTWVRN